MKFSRIVVVALVMCVSVLLVTPVWAAAGNIDRFELTDATDKDFAGSDRSIGRDSKPDAEFIVKVSGRGGAILGFSLKNLSTGQEWNTSDAPNVLVVVNNKGEVMNSRSSIPVIIYALAAEFSLYANDRAAITAAGGEYELTVSFINKTTAKARTTIAASNSGWNNRPGSGSHTRPNAGNPRVISSSFIGKGSLDLVNQTNKLGSNSNPDYRIDISFAGSDTLTGVIINATGGRAPDKTWDTIQSTRNPLIAVTEQDKTTPLNSRDGSISIQIRDHRNLSLWFDSNDDLRRQNLSLTLIYTDKRTEEIDIKQDSHGSQHHGPTGSGRPQDRRGIQMQAKPVQISLDVVGKNRQKMVSGLQDYSFKIEVHGRGTVKAISVVSQNGRGRWDTIPGSSAWLTIVRMGGSQVNDTRNFSVSIPINGSESMELLMEDDGTLSRKTGGLSVSVTWDDGEVVEELFTW